MSKFINPIHGCGLQDNLRTGVLQALKRYRDTLNSLRGAKEEGRAEGRAEGILAVARKLKANGIDMAEIVDATGLTFEQINSL